ncbi:MAG: DUF2161 family putative PD-(D/E)XK-type phosphodiesterase [Clostridiales bacterium]|jgi:hypothetical protein|nr:DUF2161 family putative PD-(D/E)XK-type phosphodiesterase [Clostridiales bacterium]
MPDFSEKDMYMPVKRFFEDLGYDVRSEVMGIDATAVKDGVMLLLEFKKSFNMTLLYQVIDRQKISRHVYAVIPKKRGRDFKNILHIVKKLEIGLITVEMEDTGKQVKIEAEPVADKTLDNKRSRRVLNESQNRKIDGNLGGSVNVKLLTAFRERSIKIACTLYKQGEMTVAELKKFGCAKDTANILRNNFYGWFYMVSKGVFFLTEEGFNEIEDGTFKEAVEYYLKE